MKACIECMRVHIEHMRSCVRTHIECIRARIEHMRACVKCVNVCTCCMSNMSAMCCIILFI